MILHLRDATSEHPICTGSQLQADPDVSGIGVLNPVSVTDKADSVIYIHSSPRNTTANSTRRPAILVPQHGVFDRVGPCCHSHGPICSRSTIRLSSHYSPSYRNHNAPRHLFHGSQMYVPKDATSSHYDRSLYTVHLSQHGTHGHTIRKAQSKLSLRGNNQL